MKITIDLENDIKSVDTLINFIDFIKESVKLEDYAKRMKRKTEKLPEALSPAMADHLERMERQREIDRECLSIMQYILESETKIMSIAEERGFLTAFVSNSGILFHKSRYFSDALADLLGQRVLVSKPKDGRIKVYSTGGKYLTEAFKLKG